MNAVLDRLEASFGREPLHGLLTGLAGQLESAIRLLDDGTAGEIAHRIAGLAGTLGFGSLGQAWLDLATGDPASTQRAREETRAALAISAMRLERTEDRSTSV